MRDDFAPGHRIGNLLIEREIGRGAFASVYLAQDTLLRRPVALKVLRGAPDDPGAEAALREARLVGSLRSPHVVTLYRLDTLPTGDGWIIEMEYVEGGSLQEFLAREPRPSLTRVIEVFRGVCAGLAAAHEHGIVHGDVKPANILLGGEGAVKIADFGLSRLAGEGSMSTSGAEGLIGTPSYMAPEVIEGHRPTRSSDVWSLGVLLYRLASGRIPFAAADLQGLFVAIHNEEPPALGPEVPRGLAALALRCLAKQPHDRPASAAEVLRECDDAARRGDAPPKAPLPGPRPSSLVRGREEERRRLAAAIERVASGAGAAFLVTGEAGVGKSSLLREAGRRAEARGFLWIEAATSAAEGLFRPFLRAAGRAIVRMHGAEETERLLSDASFGALAPSLGDALLRGGPIDLASRQQVTWVFDRLLQALAARQPVGLLVEDAQEADEEELALLAELPSRTAGLPVLIAIAARTGAADSRGRHGAVETLGARQTMERIDLGPLAQEAVYEILEDQAGGVRVLPDIAARIARLSGGNPLFATELLRHFMATEAVRVDREAIVPGPSWEAETLPRRFHDLVAQRVSRLPEKTRSVLDAAAIDGVEFDGALVASVLDRPLLPTLRELQRLCRETGLLAPGASGYRFCHGLVQRIIYDEIAPPLRTALHASFAERMESAGRSSPADPERLAAHWERAGQRERAVPYLLKAATLAEKRQELRRTIDLCARAGLLPGRIDLETARTQRTALISLANCYNDLGRHKECDAVFDLLQAAAAAAGDEDLRLRVVARRAKFDYPTKGLKSIDEAALRHAAEALPASAERGVASYILGIVAKNKGDLAEAGAHLTSAERVSRETGNNALLSSVLDQRATLARLEGRATEAETLYGEAARISAAAGRRTNAAISDVNRALAAFGRGALSDLDELLSRSIRTLSLEGALEMAAHACVILAHVRLALGDLRGAESQTDEALAILDRTSYLPGRSDALLARGQCRLARGALDGAGADLLEAQRIAAQRGSISAGAFAAMIDALRLCFLGAGEAAAARVRETFGPLRGKTGAGTRAELLFWVSEAVFLGLDPSVLAEARSLLEPVGVPATRDWQRARAVAEGAVAYASGSGSAGLLREASAVLHSPETGERRAELRLFGRLLAAEAFAREERHEEAVKEAEAALGEATAFGHVCLQAELLDRLARWTGTGAPAARRSALLTQVGRALSDSAERRRFMERHGLTPADGASRG